MSVGVLVSATSVNAEGNQLGQQLFADTCVACHGTEGKGDGPITQYLNVPPADLTVISKNNDGEFPFLKIYQIVDGRTGVRGHGNAAGAMPIWGERFSREIDTGNVPFGAELYARARLIAIVDYIESIQQK
ncbi:MAG: cytochrome c [Hoeflea sp.]|nr:cytochrome c [Hoeflea sp.]